MAKLNWNGGALARREMALWPGECSRGYVRHYRYLRYSDFKTLHRIYYVGRTAVT